MIAKLLHAFPDETAPVLANATAEESAVGTRRSASRTVLVAEDGPVTHDLLKLLLSYRGHTVDIVTDGAEALEALRKKPYDVALLDFHLPKKNGVEVAAAIRHEVNGHRFPRLVAITADIEGMLAAPRNCENFDYVLPKPLDVYEVGRVVEEQGAISDRALRSANPAPVARVESEAPSKRPSLFDSSGYKFLVWPDDLETTRLSPQAMQASLGDPSFDAILIKEPASADDLASIWRRKALHVLPVIDLTGTLGGMADFVATELRAPETNQLDQLIRAFQDQRARLHRDLLFSTDLREQLFARIYVSGKPLKASYNPRSQCHVTYNTILDERVAAREAESLYTEHLLTRDFFDRLHVCPRCDSARMHVREECSKCRSSNLSEAPYLHHFRCAHQGAESEFRRGDDLICPKCRRELGHFGFDYDRPGTMVVCGSCGHAASEPVMGLVCLDCGTHVDSERTTARDAYSYRLTEQGIGFAEHGRSFLGVGRRALRFTELPIELVVALNAAARQFGEDKTPFTVLNIFYLNEREIVGEHGARQFAAARDLFLENLRTALGATALMVKGLSYDVALITGTSPDRWRGDFDRLRQRSQSNVRLDLGAKFQAFGPEDFV